MKEFHAQVQVIIDILLVWPYFFNIFETIYGIYASVPSKTDQSLINCIKYSSSFLGLKPMLLQAFVVAYNLRPAFLLITRQDALIPQFFGLLTHATRSQLLWRVGNRGILCAYRNCNCRSLFLSHYYCYSYLN